MNNKALVLGGKTGLLGQALVQVLAQRQWEVACLGRDDGNLLDEAVLRARLEAARAQVVFNTIAWTQVDAAEDDASGAGLWNRTFPGQLARLTQELGVHLVHYSTDFVFSPAQRPPTAWTEESEPCPACVYGRTKLEGERAVLAAAPDHACVLRTAWLFGPGRKNFVTTILEACRQKDGISVVHDQVGSPTYTLDLALWSALVAEKRLTGLYHAVNGGRASWCDLACEAISLAETSCRVTPVTSEEWPQKATRPRYSVLNTDKLAAALGMQLRAWPLALREFIYNHVPHERAPHH